MADDYSLESDDIGEEGVNSAENVDNTSKQEKQKGQQKEPQELTIQEKVNAVVSKMVQKDDGSWELPEEIAKDLDPAMLYAIRTERRYRDTQAGYTKAQQKTKALETMTSELIEHMVTNATIHLTQEERDELDDLRTSNPEAWRVKINEHEQKAKDLQLSKVDEFRKKGETVSEEELRRAAYADFTERTGIELSDSVLENNVPAGYQKKLSDGTWTFEQFLDNVEEFLKPQKSIANAGKGSKADNPPSMRDLPGSQAPSEEAQEGDAAASYENETF